jgi:hypothetical protein
VLKEAATRARARGRRENASHITHFSSTIWWMMPLPGFQNPMPNLAPAEARKE